MGDGVGDCRGDFGADICDSMSITPEHDQYRQKYLRAQNWIVVGDRLKADLLNNSGVLSDQWVALRPFTPVCGARVDSIMILDDVDKQMYWGWIFYDLCTSLKPTDENQRLIHSIEKRVVQFEHNS